MLIRPDVPLRAWEGAKIIIYIIMWIVKLQNHVNL